jgi:hypothetical protein
MARKARRAQANRLENAGTVRNGFLSCEKYRDCFVKNTSIFVDIMDFLCSSRRGGGGAVAGGEEGQQQEGRRGSRG